MKTLIKALVVLMPWSIRRYLLHSIFGYSIAKDARIGFSWVYPAHLEMGPGSRIGSLNVIIHLDCLRMGESSRIGRQNWITGASGSRSYRHQKDRRSDLLLGPHSAITKHHHIDCTSAVYIGAFSTLAGYSSQFLTHSIDIIEGRQDSKPIVIGSYCFIGTRCVVLGGAALPDYSVLGAASLLNRAFVEPYCLYAGVPAKRMKEVVRNARYFQRETGFVE